MTDIPVPEIIRELCQQLNQNRIHYCHWKSNAALDRSASGENDLDMLISKADADHFNQIITQLGCKQAIKKSKYQLPGIEDYFAYDGATKKLIHLHIHYQLVLGHDATKNYHIPVEEAYIASSFQNGMFMVPAPEFELIILVIRLIIKHYTWDTILLGQGNLSISEKNELSYLLTRTSDIKIYEVLKEHFKYIDPNVFADCLSVLINDRPIWTKSRVGQKLIDCLSPYARQPQFVDSFLKLWRRFYWPVEKRIMHKDERNRMNHGGLMIAVVGGDGAGKTTVVDEIVKWLSREFQVLQFHMGKPKWSFQTIFIRGILKIGRFLRLYPFERAEYIYTDDRDLQEFTGYPSLIRGLCTARDRYLTYTKARRHASNGAIVLLDRFPLTQVKFMDGPHLARVTANLPETKLLKRLINMEENYYKKMALPDLLIILRLNPDIAVLRKTDEKETSVRARSSEIWEMNWDQTYAHVIDANHPKEEVFQEVKQLIWAYL